MVTTWQYLYFHFLAGKQATVFTTTATVLFSVTVIFIYVLVTRDESFKSNSELSNLQVQDFLGLVFSESVKITYNFTIIYIIIYENKEKQSPISETSLKKTGLTPTESAISDGEKSMETTGEFPCSYVTE